VFLVGAAWMPLGFRSVDRWIRLGNLRAVAELAIILALQILGGDPQAAYVVVIASAGYAIVLARLQSEGNQPKAARFSLPLAIGLAFYACMLGLTWISLPRTALALAITAWLGVCGWIAWRADRQRRLEGLGAQLVGLAAACLLALLLSAAQVVPVMEF